MSDTTTPPTTPTRQVPISEAAWLLKVSRRTVERRLSAGLLTGRKVGGHWLVDVPHIVPNVVPQPPTPIRQDIDKPNADVHNPDIDVLRARVSELCDTLTTEKAEAIREADALAVQVSELDWEKAGLVEKLGDVTGERDYLRNALAAALTRPPISRRRPKA